jgi:hypothetical protein
MPVSTLAPTNRRSTKPDIQSLLQVCRNLKVGTFKAAAAVGESESTFEQAMSNLAHATVRDRAPGLMDFELGFQLVEKNEDNDRAVGVFAFKVGPQMMYVPIFFLNGQIKGHELLYLKESDTFVPLDEDWVNYLLARKPILVGDSISQQQTHRGVRQPDLTAFRESPSAKLGSAHAWEEDALPILGYLADVKRHAKYELKLPQLIKNSSAHAVSFCKMLDAYPTLMAPFVECYGADFIKTAIQRAEDYHSAFRGDRIQTPDIIRGSVFKEAAAQSAAFDPTYGGKLQIFKYSGERPAGLTDDEASQLLTERVLIKDAREKHAEVFIGEELRPLSLQNPTETGVYSVLVKPGGFERCFVALSPRQGDNQLPPTVLVRLEDKRYTGIASQRIWVESQESPTDYGKWLDGLPSAKELEKGSDYILVGPRSQALGPFTVEASAPSGEGESCYRVWWLNAGFRSLGPGYQPKRRAQLSQQYDQAIETISIGLIGGPNVAERSGIFYVPKGWKAIKLKPDSADRESAFRPGDLVDVTVGILKKTAELKVWTDDVEVEIAGRRMPKLAAKLHLIREHGMDEKTAVELLKIAKRRGGARFRVKQADDIDGSPYDQYGGGFSPPSWPDTDALQSGNFLNRDVPTSVPQEWNLPVQSNYPQDTRSMAEPPQPDPDAMNNVQQAVQLGQREVLDTSAFTSLLNTSRADSGIDQYLSAVMEGLDAEGRLLFNYYWHNDMFGERYGDNELAELEDLLRAAFESTGKLLLRLRQETIEPFPGESFEMGIGEDQ